MKLTKLLLEEIQDCPMEIFAWEIGTHGFYKGIDLNKLWKAWVPLDGFEKSFDGPCNYQATIEAYEEERLLNLIRNHRV